MKLLLSRELLVPIVRTQVDEFADCSDEEIWNCICHSDQAIDSVPIDQDTAVSVDTVDKSLAEGEVRFDVLLDVQVPHGEKIRLFINLESQQKFDPGYAVTARAAYYTARLISRQKGTVFTGSNYQKLRKVYSIWILTRPPKEYAWTATAYFENFKCLVGDHKRPKQEWDYHYILELCVGNNPHKERPGNENVKWLIRVLSCVFTVSLMPSEKVAGLASEGINNISKEFRKELTKMTTYAQGIFDDGYAKGDEYRTKQVVINLLKKGFDDSMIKEITSCNIDKIEDIAKECGMERNA